MGNLWSWRPTASTGKVTRAKGRACNQEMRVPPGLCRMLRGRPAPGWNDPRGRGEGGQKMMFGTQNSRASYPPQIQKIPMGKEKAPRAGKQPRWQRRRAILGRSFNFQKQGWTCSAGVGDAGGRRLQEPRGLEASCAAPDGRGRASGACPLAGGPCSLRAPGDTGFRSSCLGTREVSAETEVRARCILRPPASEVRGNFQNAK